MAENRKRITRRTTSRATVLTMVFGALAIIVAIRLAYLQVYSYDYYKEQVMNEITMETEVNPERGTIYDTNGNILATNATVYLCFISPQDIIDAMAKEEDEGKDALYTWKASDAEYKDIKMN